MKRQGRDAQSRLSIVSKKPLRRYIYRCFGFFDFLSFQSISLFKVLKSALLRKGAILVIAALLVPGSVLFSVLNKAPVVHAAPSNYLNFQGRLLSNTGALVADGYYNINFKIYNVATDALTPKDATACTYNAGTADPGCLWTEQYYDSDGLGAAPDNRVRVVNGYFSVKLGSQTAFPSINWDQQLWLVMNIGGSAQTATPTYDGEMTPRIQLTAVPLAFVANNVKSGSTSTASTNSAAVSIASGNATGATSNSGNITIDAGTATGTAGSLLIGTVNPITAITIGSGTMTGTITLGQATTATAQLLNIQSANGTASTQTIEIGGGTSTTSGGKIVNIANGVPGASTTNTVAIGTQGSTTGTVGITLGSATAAAHTLLLQGGNGAGAGTEAIRIQTNAAGAIAIGTATQTGTIILGQATTATTQNIRISSENSTASTQTIDIGGGTSTTSGGKVVNIANGTPGASTTNTIAIGTGGSTTGTVGITIGSFNAANHTLLLQGGNSNAAGSEAIRIIPNAAGGVAIGGTTMTGTITIGKATGTNNIDIGSANSTLGLQTITIGGGNASGGGSGKTINIGNGTPGASASNAINIGTNAGGAGTVNVKIGTLSATNNTLLLQGGNGSGAGSEAIQILASTSGEITIGTSTQTGKITLGNATTATTQNIRISSENSTASTQTIDIGGGTSTTSGGKVVNIANGLPGASTTNTVAIGTGGTTTGTVGVTIGSSGAAAHTLILQGGNGAGAGTEAIRIIPAAAGAIAIGGTTQTGAITLGQSTATNTISIGAGNTATGNTQTIGIGNGTPAGTGLTNITIGNILNGGALNLLSGTGNINLQSAGTATVGLIQIGAGGAGSTTPDYLALDVKSDTGDPAGGAEGYIYYNTFDNKFRCFQGAAWTDCIGAGGTSTLQTTYTASTGSTTPEIILDTTRNGIDIQDASAGTIGATQSLLSVRGVGTSSTLGASLFVVNGTGKVGIKNGGTTATPTLSYDLSFGQDTGATTRTIGVEDQVSGTTGNALTVSSGKAATTGAGGALTLQAGAGGPTSGSGGQININAGNATAGNSNGGTVAINGGSSTGTGSSGGVTISGGSATTSGTAGGAIQFSGGVGFGTGTGGGSSLLGGGGGSTGAGGTATVQGGVGGVTSGAGGAVTIQGGNAFSGNSAAGNVSILGGTPTGSGAASNITVTAGAGPSGFNIAGGDLTLSSGTGGGGVGSAGLVTVQGGSGGQNGTGGAVTIKGGVGGSVSGAGGVLTLQGGNATTNVSNGGNVVILGGASTSTGTASTISITSGAAASGNVAGGALSVTSGAGAGTQAGGLLALQGGAAGATGTGGGITLTTGAGGATSGSSGALILQSGNVTSGAAGSITVDVGTSTSGAPDIGIGSGSNSITKTITLGGATQTGTITLGQATTATTQLLNIQSANGTASTQTINLGAGTSTTSGGKVINIGTGTPGASTTNTIAIGNGGTTTGTVGVTIGSSGAAAHTLLLQGGNSVTLGSEAIRIESNTANGSIGLKSGTTTGAVNINVTNNSGTNINTGTSTGAVAIGNSAAGAITLQSASTINLTGTSTQTGLSAGSATALTVNNSTSTGSIFVAQDNGTAVLTVANDGAVTLKNIVDSTAAFQVQSLTGSTPVLTVDTTNSKTITRGTASDAVISGTNLAAATSCSGTNWAGTGPWTHTTGSVVALTCTVPASVTSGATYLVTYTIASNTTATNTLTANVGGVSAPGQGANAVHTAIVTTTSTAGISFTPTTNFNGSVNTIVLNLVTLANSTLTLQNSGGTDSLELRASGTTTNAFAGLNVGRVNTTGASNAGFGASVLMSNTTGSSNSAFGATALQNNTTGINNTALGFGTLAKNTTGGTNIAIGYTTLGNNTTGTGNIAIGSTALASNTTANDSIAIGNQALNASVSGAGNIGIGVASLQSSVTAADNTGVGYNTLSASTGGRNSAFGSSSGAANISGINNTYLGANAGFNDGNFFTQNNLSNSVAIGWQSIVQASNSLILGGQGANAVNVGIGTTIPTNTLSVSPIQYSTGTASITASGTTVTGTGTTFTLAMVGSEIIIDGGSSALAPYKGTITSFTDTTHVVVTPAAATTITTKPYRIHYIGLQVTNIGDTLTSRLSVNATAFSTVEKFRINTPTTADVTATAMISTGATGNVGLVIQAVAGQTASILEIQDSTGLALAFFNSSGNLRVNTTVQTRNTTSASNPTNTLTLASGNASGATSNSGNVAIDVGTATQTAGSILIGTINPSTAITIGGATSGAISIQSGANITIGTSDTTGTLLILDTKTTIADPTGVAGGMYYNSSSKQFRCYENGSWENCVSGLTNQDTWWIRSAGGTTTTTAFVPVGTQAPTVTGTLTSNNATDAVLTQVVTAASIAATGGYVSPTFNITQRGYNTSCSMTVRTGAALPTGARVFVGLINATPANANDTGGNHIGFRYSTVAGDTGVSTGWRASTKDGTTNTIAAANVGSSAAIAINTTYKLKMRIDTTNATVYMSVNGGTEDAVTATLPAAATALGYAALITSSDTNADTFNFGKFYCEQN